jgi:hypothetical protein
MTYVKIFAKNPAHTFTEKVKDCVEWKRQSEMPENRFRVEGEPEGGIDIRDCSTGAVLSFPIVGRKLAMCPPIVSRRTRFDTSDIQEFPNASTEQGARAFAEVKARELGLIDWYSRTRPLQRLKAGA